MLIIEDPNSVLISILVDKTKQEEKYAIAYSGADWKDDFKFGDIISSNDIDQLLSNWSDQLLAKEGTVLGNSPSPIVYI
jgi:hypothetical protein